MRTRDKLQTYRRKRDFSVTPEPSGTAEKGSTRHRYVMQMHDARRLHFDLRLEVDGVYKSWAVTRGPSLDPADRRLAVEVEDHPIEYGTFEGTIPAGEYGGGTVMLWDRGTWKPEGDPARGLRKGHLSFELEGERLKGAFHLVRMADRGARARKGRHNWLLIKRHDRWAKPGKGDVDIAHATSVKTNRSMEEIAEAADAQWTSDEGLAKKRAPRARASNASTKGKSNGGRRGKLPALVAPELTTLVERPPAGGNWIHEIKFDGYRMGARIADGNVKLITRSGLDWTHKFPAIARALGKVKVKSAWLDGEIVVPDEKGISSFSALQNALSTGDDGAMVYYLFDAPYLDGRDLSATPLVERKERLRRAVFPASKRNGSVLAYSEHHDADGADFYKAACSMALEGVVSKRKDSPYHSGRSRDWVKSKCIDRDEFVIGGYTPSRAGRGLGSLLLGHYRDGKLIYDGRTGTGFGAKEARALEKSLKALDTDTCPFEPMQKSHMARASWARPKLVVEVEHRGRSSDGLLRQAAYVGLRADKPARQVDRSDRVAGMAKEAERKTTTGKTATKKAAGKKADSTVCTVAISHPERVIDKESGATKLELAQYYGRVADTLLEDMAGRPVAVVRCPDGIEGERFFQRHPQAALTGRISTVKDPEDKEQLLCVRTARDVLTLIQFGVIEIHPWQAQDDALDLANRFILDLDPAPDVPFAAVTLAAKVVRKQLQALGLKSIVKTTGGKGLHVIVPLRPAGKWKQVKAFAKAIADSLARDQPRVFIAKASKAARTGRIYVDYLRNDRGSTAIGAYCARARPGLPVAMPLNWAAVRDSLDPQAFTIRTVRKVALPAEWRAAKRWRQSLDARKLEAAGVKE